MVVSGLSVWTKGGKSNGIQGEVEKGNFEIVHDDKIDLVWNTLLKQELLTAWTLAKNLSISREAWSAGGDESRQTNDKSDDVFNGIGEGYDEEDESFVFQSDVKVADLSDDGM